MELTVEIGCIDGESGYTMTSRSPEHSAQVATNFLKRLDHEGSSVALTVRVYDDWVYPVLAMLAELQKKQK